LQRILSVGDALTQIGVIPFNLRQLRQSYAVLTRAPLFSMLLQEEREQKRLKNERSLRHELLALEAGQERRLVLERAVSAQVSQVLRLPANRIDAMTSLQTLGIDSLMALEVRNRLEDCCEVTLSATLLWSYPTIHALTEHLAEKMELSFEQREDAPLSVALIAQTETLEDLSLEEVAGLLAQTLADLGKNR
jgi:acyl carrier protein